VAAGGAAVKFGVTLPPVAWLELRNALQARASANGYAFVFLDAASTKLHLIDRLFHAVARQVDWDTLAYDFVRSLLEANGFQVPDDRAAFNYEQLAALNNYTAAELKRDVRNLLLARVYKDYAMTQEFRIAMLRLCQAQLDPTEAELAVKIRAWLHGELRLISALKPALIFQKVARHNARDLFFSLCHWLRLGHVNGLVLVLDIARYVATRRPSEPDGTLYHTTAATMDAYEVLRQFIDATDELEGCLIVVIAPPALLDDEKRGLSRYTALQMRVWDEVRDSQRANPLAALVRLREAAS
jgi:hypothetical protein